VNNDSDLKEAFRIGENKHELNLYITKTGDDQYIKKFSNTISELSSFISELERLRQHCSETLNENLKEVENTRNTYDNIIESTRAKNAILEMELQKLRENLNVTSSECMTLKESAKKLGVQLQDKIQEIGNLKRGQDAKSLLETKVQQLEKELASKAEESLQMSMNIQKMETERNHFSKKVSELETHQQNFEKDLLSRSIQLSTAFPDPTTSFPDTANALETPRVNSAPFSLPEGISDVDIQILLSMGFLENQKEREKIFELLKKMDVSAVIEHLVGGKK
jgi:DNA repair exonuclease SbcCD ATPase subunit